MPHAALQDDHLLESARRRSAQKGPQGREVLARSVAFCDRSRRALSTKTRQAAQPRKRLFYAGVACDECGEPIPIRDFFSFEISHFTKDGGAYRVCTTCDFNESQFEATDESGYNFVLTD
jgi:hypothetical protein